MSNINLSIPDALDARVIAAFSNVLRFNENALPEETEPQFLKRKVIEYVRTVVERHEAKIAIDQSGITIEGARVAAINRVRAEVTIT